MAFASCFSTLNPPLFFSISPTPLPFSSSPSPSSSSSSLVSIIRAPRKLELASSFPKRLAASLGSRVLQSLDEDLEEGEESGDGSVGPVTEHMAVKRKKKKRKPRPSFHDQTVQRWSARIPSQRSCFPWQDQKIVDNLHSTPSGKPLETSMANPENVNVRTDRSTDDGERTRRRLDLIIEKLSDSLPVENSDSSNDHHGSSKIHDHHGSPELPVSRSLQISKHSVGMSLGHQPLLAPWVHGAKERLPTVASYAKFNKSVKQPKYGTDDKMARVGLMDEKSSGSCSRDKLSPNMDGVITLPTGKDRSEERIKKGCEVSKPLDTSFTASKPLDASFTAQSGNLGTEEVTQTAKWHQYNSGIDNISVSSIVNIVEDSMDKNLSNLDDGISFDEAKNASQVMGSDSFPWESASGSNYGYSSQSRSNTELAEKTIPEVELKRLRNAALRLKERMTVGPAGVTEVVVECIHQKWREGEVVKLRFEGAPSLNMKRTHELLEMKTGGLVIWRSGRSVVLYRGMAYQLPCVQTYSRLANNLDTDEPSICSNDSLSHVDGHPELAPSSISRLSSAKQLNSEKNYKDLPNDSDIDNLLDQLGPRFKDWSGRSPLPVDADLLPGVVPGYAPPFRVLPYKTRSALRDREMTYLRRLARTMPPHFALGRNRQHQGLASAIVKLWEKSIIAKIAIKRGLPNICNERMAEELKKLTGGVLVSRNKEYIVFYRGNDFATPSIREALMEKQKLATIHQDKEEIARLRASALVASDGTGQKGPLVAGTLAETVQAKSRWGNLVSSLERERMKKDLLLAKQVSLVRYLERKLAIAQAKVKKAERALAKVQKFLEPAELPTDLETVTDEERALFREIGLKMRGALLLGKRGVFDGTIENMHLNWKHKELVRILVKRKNFSQVKQIAISLEAESGGVLISLDKTTSGYAIVLYRGKNYQRPPVLKPRNLLSRRQALARSIELQRREALKHHISNVRTKIQLLKTELNQMEANKDMDVGGLDLQNRADLLSDDEIEDEGEEAYLETYDSSNEEDDTSGTAM